MSSREHWSAINIHLDHEAYVGLLREKTISSLEEPQVSLTRRRDSRWARVGGRRSPNRPERRNETPPRIVARPDGTLEAILIGAENACCYPRWTCRC